MQSALRYAEPGKLLNEKVSDNFSLFPLPFPFSLFRLFVRFPSSGCPPPFAVWRLLRRGGPPPGRDEGDEGDDEGDDEDKEEHWTVRVVAC